MKISKILKTAKVKVGSKSPGTLDSQAGQGIIKYKFLNRKFASSAIANSRNLKNVMCKSDVGENHDVDDGEGKQIDDINHSLCPDLGFYTLQYARPKHCRNRVMSIQKAENGRFVEISPIKIQFNCTIIKVLDSGYYLQFVYKLFVILLVTNFFCVLYLLL